jgi:hypothetical protein
MAKAYIRDLKMRRFMRWLAVEVYGKPEPRDPIKLCRKRYKRFKFNKRKQDRAFQGVWKMIEARRAEQVASTEYSLPHDPA